MYQRSHLTDYSVYIKNYIQLRYMLTDLGEYH